MVDPGNISHHIIAGLKRILMKTVVALCHEPIWGYAHQPVNHQSLRSFVNKRNQIAGPGGGIAIGNHPDPVAVPDKRKHAVTPRGELNPVAPFDKGFNQYPQRPPR